VDAEARQLPQRSKEGLAVSYDDTGISVHHNIAADTVEIRRMVNGVPMVASIRRDRVNDATMRKGVEGGLREVGMNEYEIQRLLIPIRRPGVSDNKVNTLIHPHSGYKPPPPFPRSEATQDDIMIRRVNARLKLAHERKLRHYRHVGIGLAAAFVLPWLAAIFIRSWGFCMAWIAS
jgi:hypothetical protein